jgi:beta-xylosidase
MRATWNPPVRWQQNEPTGCFKSSERKAETVSNQYYIATSTFEWYPGVQIHHSRDLANWELVVRPLDRKSQLDMRGNPDSCGTYVPNSDPA